MNGPAEEADDLDVLRSELANRLQEQISQDIDADKQDALLIYRWRQRLRGASVRGSPRSYLETLLGNEADAAEQRHHQNELQQRQ